VAEKEGKYLTFSLAQEEYGIGILKIREIIPRSGITSVPRTPEFVKGVINRLLATTFILLIGVCRRTGEGFRLKILLFEN